MFYQYVLGKALFRTARACLCNSSLSSCSNKSGINRYAFIRSQSTYSYGVRVLEKKTQSKAFEVSS